MQLTNEWIEQGVKKGLQLGRQEGARDLILRLLRKQFGTLPAKFATQVKQLDDDGILELGDALLDFTSIADAQRWLARHK